MAFETRQVVANPNVATVNKNASHVEFSATPQKTAGQIRVNWSVPSQNERTIFTLSRSYDDSNWEQVTMIEGRASKNSSALHEFLDTHVRSGVAFYKLEWADEFGNVNRSTISTEVPESNVEYRSVPNPTIGVTRISTKEPIEQGTKVRVVSVDGQRYRVPIKNIDGALEIDFTGVPEGIYMVQLPNGFVRVQRN